MIAASQERFPGAYEMLLLPGPGCSSGTSKAQVVEMQEYTILSFSGRWAVASRSCTELGTSGSTRCTNIRWMNFRVTQTCICAVAASYVHTIVLHEVH